MLPGNLYGACVNVKVTIGHVSDEHNFVIQEHSSDPLTLGQPYITAVRMETKVLDDGSVYARNRSKDGKRAIQFFDCMRKSCQEQRQSMRSSTTQDSQTISGKHVSAGFSRSTIIKRDYGGMVEGKISQKETFSSGFLGLTSEGSLSYGSSTSYLSEKVLHFWYAK
ncbi:hypothetical protein L7F22_020337 [Adiantum nelumboides]|nr:hypothetical protein [Adiantum nelumboides]